LVANTNQRKKNLKSPIGHLGRFSSRLHLTRLHLAAGWWQTPT